MAAESALRQRIVALLRENGIFAQSIESETNPGLPDIYYRGNGLVGWLELKKIYNMPKRATTSLFKSMNHSLSFEQINWIATELNHGGRADILVGYERNYYLVPGSKANIFNNFTESDLAHYQLTKDHIVPSLTKLHEEKK